MEKGDKITPSHVFRFKDVPGSSSGGCHALVWLPTQEQDGKARPVAIMIHGGGFTMEAADDIPFNNVNYYLENGFIVVSLEYRLVPHVKLDDIRQDLLEGYLFVHSRLEQELQAAGSSVKPDATKMNVQGWSAGGTATVFLSADIQQYNEAASDPVSLPKANIITYPLTQPHKHHNKPRSALDEFAMELTAEERATLNAIHDEPISTGHSHEEWTPNSKTPRMKFLMMAVISGCLNSWIMGQDPPYPASASCINTINAGTPPTAVVVATADEMLDPDDSYRFAKNLGAIGVESPVYVAQGMPHGIAEHHSNTWPEGVKWWDEAILPSLKWAVAKTLS